MIVSIILCYLAVGFICAVLWFADHHQSSGKVIDVAIEFICCALLWPMVLFQARK